MPLEINESFNLQVWDNFWSIWLLEYPDNGWLMSGSVSIKLVFFCLFVFSVGGGGVVGDIVFPGARTVFVGTGVPGA